MIPYVTDEQIELRDVVRRFLATKSPTDEVRRQMASDVGYDAEVWVQMAQGLGLQGLGISEQFGGSGTSLLELCMVQEEMGYFLMVSPYFSTMLAALTLQSLNDPGPVSNVLEAIVAGDAVASLCIADDEGATDGGTLHASGSNKEGWTLTGYASFVPDGHVADTLVAVAMVDDRMGVFVVDGAVPEVDRRLLPTLDQTRKLARIEFRQAPAQLVSHEGAEDLVAQVLDIASVLLAAEQLGGARRCLDMSVEYAKARIQFGRPIGSFQAIKHKCADMHVKVEAATSLVFYASRIAGSEQERSELPVVASMAKSYCSDSFFEVAADTIQIHGGIGFTWEHDAHLFFKRATVSRLMFGSPSVHRERLIQRLALTPS
jgi:alkylation response protein AidB-like acyl-CoA dehydrogenase